MHSSWTSPTSRWQNALVNSMRLAERSIIVPAHSVLNASKAERELKIMVMSYDEILVKIQEIVSEALGIDPEEATADARLTEDLGAESLDYLDMAFHLEKAFGITIDSNELLLTNILPNVQFVREGRITDAGMDELHRRLPDVNLNVLDQSRDPSDMVGVFTVDALARFVRAKLEQNRGQLRDTA